MIIATLKKLTSGLRRDRLESNARSRRNARRVANGLGLEGLEMRATPGGFTGGTITVTVTGDDGGIQIGTTPTETQSVATMVVVQNQQGLFATV